MNVQRTTALNVSTSASIAVCAAVSFLRTALRDLHVAAGTHVATYASLAHRRTCKALEGGAVPHDATA